MLLPGPRPSRANPFDADAHENLATALGQLAEALREHAESMDEVLDARAIVDVVDRDFNNVRRSLMPRLLALGDEPELLKSFADLEEMVETLDYDASLDERFGLPGPLFMQDIARCVAAMREVATVLQRIAPPRPASGLSRD
jgi:hypothetical protein